MGNSYKVPIRRLNFHFMFSNKIFAFLTQAINVLFAIYKQNIAEIKQKEIFCVLCDAIKFVTRGVQSLLS